MSWSLRQTRRGSFLEAAYLNTDPSIGISVVFKAKAPNGDTYAEFFVRDVSAAWAYAGYVPISFHDSPMEPKAIRVETASVNGHRLVSFDNIATRVNFGLSNYGVDGVGFYNELIPVTPGLRAAA